MVDRGEFSFEILMSLLVIKLEDPAAVHILRGNHETKEMYDTYGFREEIQELYDVEVFAKFQELLRGQRYDSISGDLTLLYFAIS